MDHFSLQLLRGEIFSAGPPATRFKFRHSTGHYFEQPSPRYESECRSGLSSRVYRGEMSSYSAVSKEHGGVAASVDLCAGTESIVHGVFFFEIADGSVGLHHPSLHLTHHVRASFGPVIMMLEHLLVASTEVLFGDLGNYFSIAARGIFSLADFNVLLPHRPVPHSTLVYVWCTHF